MLVGAIQYLDPACNVGEFFFWSYIKSMLSGLCQIRFVNSSSGVLCKHLGTRSEESATRKNDIQFNLRFDKVLPCLLDSYCM